ncbi:MAG: DUF3788 domain-containing protein [Nitrososphaerota archaeon]|jgi:hypothetical protein|nr:DUF3788 domain-containing protein [Nitrososphaerota archaeon]
MYERLLDKCVMPDEVTIQGHLGQSWCRFIAFENHLSDNYQLVRELKFPFGDNYGWGYKYSHKLHHLCYVFFEKDAFTVMLQIGDKQVPILESQLTLLLHKTQELWKNRYPCGEHGGWIHYRVLVDDELTDVIKLLAIRKTPCEVK